MGWIIELYRQLTDLDFWISALEIFKDLGPLMPILLTLIESLIPALPLFAIVAINVVAYGSVFGLVYSWIGTVVGCYIVFYFFRLVVKKYVVKLSERFPSLKKANGWVTNSNRSSLFILAMLPFTPSAFLNIAFGLSDYNDKEFLKTVFFAKIINISCFVLFGNSLVYAIDKPVLLIVILLVVLVLYLIVKQIRSTHNL